MQNQDIVSMVGICQMMMTNVVYRLQMCKNLSVTYPDLLHSEGCVVLWEVSFMSLTDLHRGLV